MAVGTPFHSRTAPLNTSLQWRHWSGYFAASCYNEFHQPEYAAIRNGAALIDVSPLFKYRLRGRHACGLLDRLVTRDIRRMRPGQVVYTPWCDAEGKILQEGTVFRFGEDDFQLTATDSAWRWLRMNAIGLEVEIEDVSSTVATVAVQGPNSRALLARAVEAEIETLKFFRFVEGTVDGVGVAVSRTGYTGDLGYEVWVAAEHAGRVWDALIRHGEGLGASPCGLMAMDVARIEAGFVLLGVDYVGADKALIPSQKSSPYEVGLGWAVKLGKAADFIGRRALEREKETGSAWQLVGLEIPWQPLEDVYASAGLMPDLPLVPWRTPLPLYKGERQVGRATCGCWSTLLKKYIVIASVETPHAKRGTDLDMEVTVDYERREAPAKIVDLPFFRPDRLRA